MTQAAIQDDELDGLSEEERMALEDDEIEEDVAENETEDDLEADNEETEADEAQTDADTSEDTADKSDGAVAAKAADEPVVVPDEFQHRYEAEPVEDYEKQVESFAEQKKVLRQQYQDGDLDLDEYENQKEEIAKQELDLHDAKLKADLATDQNRQVADQRWQWEQERFLAQKENTIYQDSGLYNMMSTYIQELSNDQANEGKPYNWFLEEADRRVRNHLVAPKQPKKSRKASRGNIPPNLGDLPAAEQAETSSDEFSKLDGLDGMALEKALAKMSQSEQDRYLRG